MNDEWWDHNNESLTRQRKKVHFASKMNHGIESVLKSQSTKINFRVSDICHI